MLGLKSLILLLSIVTTSAFAGTTAPKTKSDRVVVISGPISMGFQYTTQHLIALTKESKKPIKIIINSPGGSVYQGFNFLKVMRAAKADGIKLKCTVTGMAASMAFIIFDECTHRRAFATSMLLWHPVRTQYMGILRAQDAKLLAYRLEQLDKTFMPNLKKHLKLPGDLFETHSNNDIFMQASVLNNHNTKYLKIIRKFEGPYGF